MSRREDKVLLSDILVSIDIALAHLSGMSLDALQSDQKTIDALAKRIEAIGEAASRISGATCALAPEVPWASIIGMRHKLVHDYFGVDVEFIWRTTTEHLSGLRSAIQALIEKSSH